MKRSYARESPPRAPGNWGMMFYARDLELRSENGVCFFDHLEDALASQQGTFKINGSFSHFILDKRELIEVGFFDERLLGLGDEVRVGHILAQSGARQDTMIVALNSASSVRTTRTT